MATDNKQKEKSDPHKVLKYGTAMCSRIAMKADVDKVRSSFLGAMRDEITRDVDHITAVALTYRNMEGAAKLSVRHVLAAADVLGRAPIGVSKSNTKSKSKKAVNPASKTWTDDSGVSHPIYNIKIVTDESGTRWKTFTTKTMVVDADGTKTTKETPHKVQALARAEITKLAIGAAHAARKSKLEARQKRVENMRKVRTEKRAAAIAEIRAEA